MRKVEYLSPTSISQFETDRREFYLRYLAENRPPKIPQNRPMSIGSAFDAYLKSYLSGALFGKVRPGYELKEIFEAQVEPQNRDWAWENGKYVFDAYKASGAIAELMLELATAVHEPRMEFTVKDTITLCGVPITLLGKPDLYFVSKGGNHNVWDFKVNGYCGSGTTSPKAGYVMVRGTWGRGNGSPHGETMLMNIGGINVNIATPMEVIDNDWANQLAIYGWILGESVGSGFISGIEQLVFKAVYGGKPSIRVASFRNRISEEYQKGLAFRIATIAGILESGHIFSDVSRAESDAICKMLDDYYKVLGGDSARDKWFDEVCREDNW